MKAGSRVWDHMISDHISTEVIFAKIIAEETGVVELLRENVALKEDQIIIGKNYRQKIKELREENEALKERTKELNKIIAKSFRDIKELTMLLG